VTQIITDAGGAPHVAFFARSTIRAGQELTFDYRFREEGEGSKVACQCGAPSCRGYLN
jgi:SET domain-containing protein